MKRLIYLLTHNLTNPGVVNKFNGQILSLKNKYKIKRKHIKYSKKDLKFVKLIKILIFDIQSILIVSFYDIIYCRYSTDNAFLIVFLMLLSYVKCTYIEINTIDAYELDLAGRYIAKKVNLLLLRLFKYSNIRFVVVTKEIGRYLCCRGITKNKIYYIQNGYSYEIPQNPYIDYNTINKVTDFTKKFKKSGVFTGNDFPWNGIDEIIKLFQNHYNIGLILIGKYKLTINVKNILLLGNLNLHTIREIYKSCDFAIGSFGLHIKMLTEACPLKTREYLFNGLPILVNYYDGAADFDELRPFVYNVSTNKNAFNEIVQHNHEKEIIITEAEKKLSWDHLLKNI